MRLRILYGRRFSFNFTLPYLKLSCRARNSSQKTPSVIHIKRCNPVRLAYNVFEPKSGCDIKLFPIIFIHGILSSKESWKSIPQAVSDGTRRRSYAIDMRNHGDSEWSEDASVEALVEDTAEFLETNGIRRAIFVGHSIGGKVAMLFASSRPEKSEMLFIVDSFVRAMTSEEGKAIAALIHVCSKTLPLVPLEFDEDQAEKFLVDHINQKSASRPAGVPKPPPLTRTMAALKRGLDNRFVMKANTKALSDYITSEEATLLQPLNLNRNPAFFICGTKSPFNAHTDSLIHKYHERAEIVMMDGASHCIHAEFPTELVEVIVNRILLHGNSQ